MLSPNVQLIGEGREIVAPLPNQSQKFKSATKVQNIFFTPCFSPMKCKALGGQKKNDMKKYKVNIDMNFSQDINVSAKNETEAKKKAWEKFIAKKPTKKNFMIYADKVDG